MDKAFGRNHRHDTKMWTWWRYANEGEEFGVSYKDWSQEATPWLDIKNGTMADKIIAVANEVYNAFKDDMHLLLGS